MKPSERIIAYIKKKKDWVFRSEIYDKAKSVGIDWEQCRESLDVVEQNLCIGVSSRINVDKNETAYIWYDRTQEDLKNAQERLEWFNSL